MFDKKRGEELMSISRNPARAKRCKEKPIHVASWAIPAEYAGEYECMMN